MLYVNITVADVLERLSLLIRLTHKHFDSEHVAVIQAEHAGMP